MEEISFLTDPSCFKSVQLDEIKLSEELDEKVKPRRRLADTKEDASLAPLISKTRAIRLENVEEKVNLIMFYI
jgi:hypothetical protein